MRSGDRCCDPGWCCRIGCTAGQATNWVYSPSASRSSTDRSTAHGRETATLPKPAHRSPLLTPCYAQFATARSRVDSSNILGAGMRTVSACHITTLRETQDGSHRSGPIASWSKRWRCRKPSGPTRTCVRRDNVASAGPRVTAPGPAVHHFGHRLSAGGCNGGPPPRLASQHPRRGRRPVPEGVHRDHFDPAIAIGPDFPR